MDVEIPASLRCKQCDSTDFLRNEKFNTLECLQCGGLQEFLTAITINTVDPETNHQGLQQVKIDKKTKKLNSVALKKKIIQSIQKFKLEDMFKWIFDEQIESVRPFINDFDRFKSFANGLWARYLKQTGSGFDLQTHKLDDIRVKVFPMGWGVALDVKRIDETSKHIPTLFHKQKRQHKEEDEEDLTEEEIEARKKKQDKNAKKLKIEKLVKANLDESLSEKMAKFKKGVKEEEKEMDVVEVEKVVKVETLAKKEREVHPFVMKLEEALSSESESDESALSDEEDPEYVKCFNFPDKKSLNIVRLMRKKKEPTVLFNGSRSTMAQLLMENNLILLFFCLYITRVGKKNFSCFLDVWRLAKKGVIPFLKIGRFIPVEKYFLPHKDFQDIILRDTMPNFKKFKLYSGYLAQLLCMDKFRKPDTDTLVLRLLEDNNLPRDLEYMIYHIKSKTESYLDKYYKIKPGSEVVETRMKWSRFVKHDHHILHPELSCLAYIFIVLRTMLRVDGQFEYEMSSLAKKVQDSGMIGSDARLFIWTDWVNEMRRQPTISSARCSRQFGQVTDARVFLEQGLREPKGLDQGLTKNDFFNSVGRYVNIYDNITHENVLLNLMKPFQELSNKRDMGPLKRATDFRSTSIQYLVSPDTYLDQIMQEPDNGSSSTMDGALLHNLIDKVIQRPLSWRELGLNDRHFSVGVFNKQIKDNPLTRSEKEIMDILLFNTGVSTELFFQVIHNILRILGLGPKE